MRIRTVLIGLLGVVVVLAVAAMLLRPWFARTVFERTVAARVGTDITAELPDGLHIFMCGTGSPMPDPTRAGPCVGVVAGERVFLIDAGSGGVRVLGQMRFPIGRVDRLLLTHLHSDHFDGLGETLLQAWIGGSRTSPLPVYGPPGTDGVVAGFNAAYEIDKGYRIDHHGTEVANPAGFGGEAIILQLADEFGDRLGDSRVIWQDGDLTVTAILMHHEPVVPAYGFRIDYKDRSVVLSGDTTYQESLVALAKGADVLVHEALDPEMVAAIGEALANRGQANLAKVMSDIPDYHASPEDAARAAAESGVDALFLYHIVPPLPSPMLYDMFLGDAGDIYGGLITVSEDGLLISLPAGSKKIETQELR